MSLKRVRDEKYGTLVRLPEKVVSDAAALLKESSIVLEAWPGAFLTGGVACAIVRGEAVPETSDLDFLVPEAWKGDASNPIRKWASAFDACEIMTDHGVGGAYLCVKERGGRLIQFFPTTDVEASLEAFDLAPCRVAISSNGAFCTDDALYAFATRVCRNSCGTPDRLKKYEARGFDTAGLPETMAGRAAWDHCAYADAAKFIGSLLGIGPGIMPA